MLFSKKGQDEGTAHILIALMAIFIVVFILFIPPEERAALLDDTPFNGVARDSGKLPANVLFEKSVGRLEFYPPEGFDHQIPSTYIFSARSAVELEKFPTFIIKRSWFVNKQEEFTFLIEDLDHTKNLILAFDAPVSSGLLQILLNGQSVFEGILTGPTIEPIKLPALLLKPENTISFMAGRVGGKFWATNIHNLHNARIIGDLTDLSRTSSSSVFTLSPTEKENLVSARLATVPVCDPNTRGLFTITINDEIIYSGIPECGIPLRQSISLSTLSTGTNTVRFSTDKGGDYRLEKTSIDTDLKDVRNFIEYFEVPPRLFESVLRGTRRVILEIDFVDDGKRKRAELNINGHLTFIDQKEPYYTRVLNAWLQPGARNYIELIPETPLNIVQVKVRHT